MGAITRRLLSLGGAQGVLSRENIDAALDVSGLRPGRAEWRGFAARTLRLAGVLSLAAGLQPAADRNGNPFRTAGGFGFLLCAGRFAADAALLGTGRWLAREAV